MKAVPAPDAEFPFTFSQFEEWYEELTRAQLEPARVAFERMMTTELRTLEIESGTGRFRTPTSRIKEPFRLWAKMKMPKYSGRITQLGDIPKVIDDLIGVRIVCVNKADLNAVRKALDGFARSSQSNDFGIAIEDNSERDYLSKPKDSGYRAYHANLVTRVSHRNGMFVVRGELQVRTLLQDGWGELTHEDTYKPDQEVPPIVEVLALRMGELLATVDDIAQDIRQELGRDLEAAVVDDAKGAAPDDKVTTEEPTALSALVAGRAASIITSSKRPLALSQIATQLRGTFGGHELTGWFGHGAFKNFLLDAVPGARIIPIGPSYAVPPGVEPDETWPEKLRRAVEGESSPRREDPS
ncbi:hypothetical protein FA014_03815 [Cellulomonas hominis]|uniref:RelA/SpoT domain-containing protein n=1 Tax=Cellulomonas hominis TaxID=156981 RepID=A0A7Z8K2I0_9CELL|nr:hypothetical protein [Cellulomonas hominis]TKR26782.1 hypothetical protein FA014_03815 [Cellulomonas hominis]